METQFPLEDEDTKTDEHGEVLQGKPRVKKEDGTVIEYEWNSPDLPWRFQKMRRCMRTDGCSASMLWAFQSAGVVNFGNWASLESFAYSLCRTSANVMVFHSCDWTQTPPEAIKCFTLMLERAGMQCKIPPERGSALRISSFETPEDYA